MTRTCLNTHFHAEEGNGKRPCHISVDVTTDRHGVRLPHITGRYRSREHFCPVAEQSFLRSFASAEDKKAFSFRTSPSELVAWMGSRLHGASCSARHMGNHFRTRGKAKEEEKKRERKQITTRRANASCLSRLCVLSFAFLFLASYDTYTPIVWLAIFASHRRSSLCHLA